MTVFNVTAGNMINIFVIAAGIGICGMNILQVSTGARLSKEATRYFQLFFGMVMLYYYTTQLSVHIAYAVDDYLNFRFMWDV